MNNKILPGSISPKDKVWWLFRVVDLQPNRSRAKGSRGLHFGLPEFIEGGGGRKLLNEEPVSFTSISSPKGMSSLVYATGHIKDPVPLIAKRRGLSPGGRFPPSFIHQVIIITGLNSLSYTIIVCSRPEDGLRCWQGVNPPLKHKFFSAGQISLLPGWFRFSRSFFSSRVVFSLLPGLFRFSRSFFSSRVTGGYFSSQLGDCAQLEISLLS